MNGGGRCGARAGTDLSLARITIMQRSHSDDLASRIIDDGAAVLEIPMEWHEGVRAWPLDKGGDGL